MKKGALLAASLLLLTSLAFGKVEIEAAEEVQVVFTYENPDVGAVYIAGSFNGWNGTANPMSQDEEGLWTYVMTASSSETIQYKFVLEGEEWITDPDAPATVDDGYSGLNGVVNVGVLMLGGGDEAASAGGGLMFGTYSYCVLDTNILTRDIMSGTTDGYDLDSVSLQAESYWKITGEAFPGMNLYAELQVMQGEATFLQKAQDSRVPDTVTWADGLANFGDLFIYPFSKLNDGEPIVGHLKATFTTPFVDFYTGYHYAKGTTHSFLYDMVSESDANDGFMEISNGDELVNLGDMTLDAVIGLNKRSGYGAYNWGNLQFGDHTVDVGFNINTNKDDLFYFFDDFGSMVSLGYNGVFGPLTAKIQWIGNMGVDSDGDFYHMFGDLDQNALGLEVEYSSDLFGIKGYGKWGGDSASTIYGGDTEAGDLLVGLEPWAQPVDLVKFGLDSSMTFTNGTFAEGSTETFMGQGFTTYLKPWAEFTLSDFVPFDMTASVMAKMNLDLISLADDAEQPIGFKFYNTGLKVAMNNLSEGLTSLSATYGLQLDYSSWNAGYALNEMDNSLMLEAGLAGDIGLTAGMILRSPMDGMLDALAAKVVPFGFMLGGSWTVPSEELMKPVLYGNFTYNMDAYDKNALNFNDTNTYMPEDVDGGAGESHFRVGMIWSF